MGYFLVDKWDMVLNDISGGNVCSEVVIVMKGLFFRVEYEVEEVDDTVGFYDVRCRTVLFRLQRLMSLIEVLRVHGVKYKIVWE